MFGSLGFPEILLILVLALLIFGPKRLPEVGRTLGKGLSEFRRASADLKRTVNAELALDEDEHTRSPRRPETSRALAGGAAGSTAAARPAEAAVEPRPAEGTAARQAPTLTGAPAAAPRSADSEPGMEPASESAAAEAEPEPQSESETETAATATTH